MATTSIATYGVMDSSTSLITYTLHPSDNLFALITPVLLQGDNYSEWAMEVWNSLQAKQKIVFLMTQFKNQPQILI